MKLLILILILYFYRILQNSNNTRHLDNSFFFAHFSKINSKNFFVYPELLLTSPIYITLHEGESIYIPAKWWHWIRSEKSIAMNFWCLDDCQQFSKPIVLFDTIKNKDIIVDKIQNYKKDVITWNSFTDKTLPGTLNTNKNNNYIITLPGYTDNNEKLNTELLEYIRNDISIPRYFKDNDVDINLWISTGKHDTGLHYDDKSGILSVLKGKKYVTLYPPKDTLYLHPYEVVPSWAKTYPYKVEYNVFYFNKKLKNSLPSSRLLYESLQNAKYRSEIIRTLNTVPDKSVWGCKKEGKNMRWEIYQYQYDIKESSKITPLLRDHNVVITSKDVYDTPEVIGHENHIYTRDDTSLDYPFFGHGYKNENETESIFVLDYTCSFKNNFMKYMKHIGFEEHTNKFHQYLNNYTSKHICASNKFKDQLFLQYIGITVEEFLSFLIRFEYDQHLIKHVMNNMHLYRDINHEITIVYDIKTMKPVRSGFYGIIMK